MRRAVIASFVALILLAPSQGSAQAPQSFADLALWIDLGDRVRIVDRSEVKTTGRLTRLTREAIAIEDDAGEKRFASDSVSEVAVQRHPLGKGALIGAGVFAVLGAVACFRREDSSGCAIAGPLAAAPIGAGVGVAAGTLISQMKPVYRRPASGVPAPLPRDRSGVQASLLEDLGLRVNLDDRLRVEDRSAVRTTGRLTHLTDDAITVQTNDGQRQFMRETIHQVEKRQRPLRLATLIGAGAGAAFGAVAGCAGEDRSECPDAWILGSAFGAGAGLAVGALIHKTTVVYPVPEGRTVVSPAIARAGAGVRVNVIW